MRVAVIGGGVNGACVAFFLSYLGEDVDVSLYESGNIAGANGTTAYSAGIIRHGYTNERQVEIARRGSKILYNLEEYTGEDGGVHRNGYLKLVNEDGVAAARNIAKLMERYGIDIELLEPEDLDSHFPGIDPSGVALGVLDKEAGFGDPALVTNAFVKGARQLGAEIHTKTPVIDIHLDGNTVTSIETEKGREEVDHVVNAAGPKGAHVGEMVGLDLPLHHVESRLVFLKSETEYKLSYPSVSDVAVRPDIYTKAEPGNEFLVGGIERPTANLEEGPEGVDTEHLEKVLERLEQRFPMYSDAKVVNSWAGIETMSPDSHHIVGEPRGLQNFHNLVGTSGHGFKEAPAWGESLAQTILGREPRIDLTQYRLERFEEDEPITQDKELFGEHHEG